MFDSAKRHPRRHMLKAGIAAAVAVAAGGAFFAATAEAAPPPATARVAIANSSDDINSARVNGQCIIFAGYPQHVQNLYTNVWVSNSANVTPDVQTYGGNRCEGNTAMPSSLMNVHWDGPTTTGGYRWLRISNRVDD